MKIEFEWKKIFTVLILGFLFFLIGIQIDPGSKFWLAVMRIVLLIIYPVILYQFRLFEAIEIQRAREGIVKLRQRVYKKP